MNPTANPLISVVMPVHNARPFLDEAIKSILEQTLADFEFVILDDASTDGSGELLREWSQRDSRIHLFKSERQQGLSRSSNMIVSKARATIVARMDADDISHPERLKRQWAVLESRPDVVVVGTLCDGIDATGQLVRPRDRWRVVRRSQYIPFPHGSAMFRKEAFEVVEGYCEDYTSGEDQNFFFKMTNAGRVVTLPDLLYHFRYHSYNATLLNSARAVRAVTDRYSQNGADLAGFYMLGAMRLWAGAKPSVLPQMLAIKSLKWNIKTLIALVSAAWGNISPGSLRLFLRSFIRTRDLVASLRVKDGRPYEWRLE